MHTVIEETLVNIEVQRVKAKVFGLPMVEGSADSDIHPIPVGTYLILETTPTSC